MPENKQNHHFVYEAFVGHNANPNQAVHLQKNTKSISITTEKEWDDPHHIKPHRPEKKKIKEISF